MSLERALDNLVCLVFFLCESERLKIIVRLILVCSLAPRGYIFEPFEATDPSTRSLQQQVQCPARVPSVSVGNILYNCHHQCGLDPEKQYVMLSSLASIFTCAAQEKLQLDPDTTRTTGRQQQSFVHMPVGVVGNSRGGSRQTIRDASDTNHLCWQYSCS